MKNIPVEQMCSFRLPAQVQKKRMERVIRQELTPLQQEILASYYLKDMTMEEIARQRGVSRSSVCRCLQRAMQRLRRHLQY